MIAPRRWFLCLDLSEYVETLKNDSEKLKALLSCIYLVLLKIEDSGSKILVSYCFLGQLLLSGLKTQYFNLKFDTDFFCIRLCSSLHLGKGFFFVFFFFFSFYLGLLLFGLYQWFEVGLTSSFELHSHRQLFLLKILIHNSPVLQGGCSLLQLGVPWEADEDWRAEREILADVEEVQHPTTKSKAQSLRK